MWKLDRKLRLIFGAVVTRNSTVRVTEEQLVKALRNLLRKFLSKMEFNFIFCSCFSFSSVCVPNVSFKLACKKIKTNKIEKTSHCYQYDDISNVNKIKKLNRKVVNSEVKHIASCKFMHESARSP